MFVMAISVFNSCKPPRFPDAVAYNDSIIDRIDRNTDVLSALDDKLTDDDGSTVMTAWKAAEDTITSSLNYIKGMGDFKDYPDFRIAAEKFVQADLDRVHGDYKNLADTLLKYGDEISDSVLENYNQIFRGLSHDGNADMQTFNEAQAKFAAKFNFMVEPGSGLYDDSTSVK